MGKKRLNIVIGQEYGWLTVIDHADKDRFGHLQWLVRCRCGYEYVVPTSNLSKAECKCKKCGIVERHRKICNSHIGEIINGFQILEEYGYDSHGAILYKCKCLKCESIVIRSRGSLTTRKGNGCENCRPQYHFIIRDGVAYGLLPNGTPFQIDADLVSEFSQYYWNTNANGYIQRTNRKMPRMFLHWFVLGYKSTRNSVVDHINRNKTDCRRDNLRIISPDQNAKNHSKVSTNRSGYTGVFWNERKKRWVSYIFNEGRHIYLGYLKDKIEAAQRYNCACVLLRGKYAGELNDVPEASIKTKQLVIDKLKQHFIFTADKAVNFFKEAS